MKPAILLGVANYPGEKLFNVLLTLSLSSKACNQFTSLITRTGDGIPYPLNQFQSGSVFKNVE